MRKREGGRGREEEGERKGEREGGTEGGDSEERGRELMRVFRGLKAEPAATSVH